MKLSEAEFEGLRLIRDQYNGAMLMYHVPDKNEKDLFGFIIPGIRVYKKLEEKGLVVITEEDTVVFDDGTEFDFTPQIEITDEGNEVLTLNKI